MSSTRPTDWSTASSTPWSEPSEKGARAAGFVAEFCSLGGHVTHRLSAPVTGPQDHAELVAAFPTTGIDGVFVATHNPPLDALLDAHPFFSGDVADGVIAGFITLDSNTTGYSELAPQLEGIVFPEPAHDPLPSGPAYELYAFLMRDHFPEREVEVIPFAPGTSYYTAVESVLLAYESVAGDLSDGQEKFQQALSDLRFDSPVGPVELDENRNAIGRAVASRLVIDDERLLQPENVHRIDGVEQTYNGYFTSDSPEPSLEGPECVAGDPPSWAVAE